MSTKAEQLIQQQKSLAEQLREAQLQQSQSSFNRGQRALKEQLRMQRVDSQASRSQLSEQGYMASRQIGQGATARGLGSSGLKDMALVQSQLAQGRGVNQIAQGNANVQRASMDAQLSLQEQLANARNAAGASYSENIINADKYGVELENQKTDRLYQLYEAALGGASGADIANLAAIGGDDLSSLTKEQQAALKSAIINPNADYASTAGAGMLTPFEVKRSGFLGDQDVPKAQIMAGQVPTFKLNGQLYAFKNNESAAAYFTNLYRDMPNADKVQVVVTGRPGGKYRVRYKVGSAYYNTMNKALESYKNSGN